MSRPCIALIADPTSPEECSEYLADAVELLTGAPPVRIDSRHFASGAPEDGGATGTTGTTGATGRGVRDGGRLRLQVPQEGLDFVPDIVLLYEIPPHRRRALVELPGTTGPP